MIKDNIEEERFILTPKSENTPGWFFGKKYDYFKSNGRYRMLEKDGHVEYMFIPNESNGLDKKIMEPITKDVFEREIAKDVEIQVLADMHEFEENRLRCYYEKITTIKKGLVIHLYSTENDFRDGYDKLLKTIDKYFIFKNLGNKSTKQMCLGLFKDKGI